MTNKIIIKKLNGDVLGNDIAILSQLPTGTTSNIFIKEKGFEPQFVGNYVTQTSQGPPPPPPPRVLWDSNVDGKWNNGTKRTITTKQNGQHPCDKSIFVAATGRPKLVIDGNGIAHLVGGSGGVDSLSLKLRSRHQAGGKPENRAGGEGVAITNNGFSCQRENYHNDHDTIKKRLPSKMVF
jgi:hypothetical protein